VWRICPVWGCYNTCWLMGLWSSQAKAEDTVPRTAWHWGIDSIVVNDLLGESGQTPFYVGLWPTWGSMNSDLMFFPILYGGSLFRDSGRHNK
jgi:hypothetical protein